MIETVLQAYLSNRLPAPVFMEYPAPPKGRDENQPPVDERKFYILEKTGGGFENQIGYATFALQSYGGSLAQTAAMNNLGVRAMLDAITLDEVSSVTLNSDYNFTDTTRKRNRYQAVFDICHYCTP